MDDDDDFDEWQEAQIVTQQKQTVQQHQVAETDKKTQINHLNSQNNQEMAITIIEEATIQQNIEVEEHSKKVEHQKQVMQQDVIINDKSKQGYTEEGLSQSYNNKEDNQSKIEQIKSAVNKEQDQWEWQDTKKQQNINNQTEKDVEIKNVTNAEVADQKIQTNETNKQIESIDRPESEKVDSFNEQQIQNQSSKNIEHINLDSQVVVQNEPYNGFQNKQANLSPRKIEQDEQFGDYEQEVIEDKVEPVVPELSKSIIDAANQFLNRIPDHSYIRLSYFQEI